MNKVLLFSSIISVLLLSGCANYRSRPLKRFAAESAHTSGKNTLIFNCTIFNVEESQTYLGRDLISAGVRPVQIEFINNSKHVFYLSEQSLNVPTLPVDYVAKLVHTDTAARITWYSVASLILWPFLIPAIVDGIGSATANRELDADFGRKALGERFVPQYTNASGIIFVPLEQPLNDIALTVMSQDSTEKFVLTPQKPRVEVK